MSVNVQQRFEFETASENALILYAKGQSLEAKNTLVMQLAQLLRAANKAWLIDLIPAYSSLLVCYDPMQIDHFAVKHFLSSLSLSDANPKTVGEVLKLPVCYGLGEPNDLEQVAQATKLTAAEVISLHSQCQYRVYAIGFAPGFAYLGELHEALQLPRLATPRKKVFAGAVAIAGAQTAVYPNESPGGWHLLGACPWLLFNPKKSPHLPFQAGDRVQFYPVDKAEYQHLIAQSSNELNCI